ncbi:MAG: transposase [Hyphomicrobiales bacterium]|nr:MAG: transposase [Hyphomicrobiales bacterium]
MAPQLITKPQMSALIENGRKSRIAQQRDQLFDPQPVIKLFTPDAQATWLLSEIDPDDLDLAFGLYDLGLGFPELGLVSLTEIRSVRGKLGLPVERDRYFKPDKPLSAYADAARAAGYIAA